MSCLDCTAANGLIMLAIMFAATLAAYFVFAQSILGDSIAGQLSSQDGSQRKLSPSTSETSSSSLYKCELSYLQMDNSLIKFSIDHLIVPATSSIKTTNAPHKTIIVEEEDFELDEISYNFTVGELKTRTRLNPKLPFIFFINGFNTLNEYGEINGTWMLDVAKNLAADSIKRSKSDSHLAASGSSRFGNSMLRLLSRLWTRASSRGEPTRGASLRANVIFLTWGIPHLLADNLLAMIPAYYKTVANYDQILEFVATTMSKLIQYVEQSRSREGWPSQLERAKYYSSFELYGHSLGSHILTDAIQRVQQTVGLGVRFGKLTGLDPATPCFLSLEHGISASKVANAVDELVVVHSNAGLAGLTSERAGIEIVLNGGTFQPGCAWYDFGCHHSRSTDILRYRDDDCQMVAYKCTSYHHFKNGACETCDQPAASKSAPRARLVGPNGRQREGRLIVAAPTRNCVLVNMREQHLDSEELIEFADYNERVRQLADNVDFTRPRRPVSRQERRANWLNETEQQAIYERKKRAFYHYVNTSPDFRRGRKSHCLQHYQLRLVILNDHVSQETQAKCRLSRFYTSGEPTDEMSLSLVYEPSAIWPKDASQGKELSRTITAKARGSNIWSSSDGTRLGAIIRDLFHSALVTFEGRPKLFVAAQLKNLRLAEIINCYRAENATSGPNFVLDIAFMSHTNERVRHAYSSVLCGQLVLEDGNSVRSYELELELCQKAQLQNVSQQIDKLLERIKMLRLDETWKVSLLNNLFSLFTEWEPF